VRGHEAGCPRLRCNRRRLPLAVVAGSGQQGELGRVPDLLGSFGGKADVDLPLRAQRASAHDLRADPARLLDNVTPGAGGSQQVFMFIGGHLASSDPAASIASFEQTYPGAQVVSAGSLGGEAACATTTARRPVPLHDKYASMLTAVVTGLFSSLNTAMVNELTS
jgi:hypothetical protein